jgi:hypothetical protein
MSETLGLIVRGFFVLLKMKLGMIRSFGYQIVSHEIKLVTIGTRGTLSRTHMRNKCWVDSNQDHLRSSCETINWDDRGEKLFHHAIQ